MFLVGWESTVSEGSIKGTRGELDFMVVIAGNEAVICQAPVHSPVAVRVRQTVFLLFASNQFAKSANAGLGLTILRDLPGH